MRIVFLALLAMLTFYVFVQRRRLPFNLMVMAVVVCAAVLFIIWPESSDTIAIALGVGTAADLVTDLILIGLLFTAVHYYAKFSTLQTDMTKVVRRLALLEHELERKKNGPTVGRGKTPL